MTGFVDKAPNNSGVYLMKDSKKGILYVGKAKNLRKRLKQYFPVSKDAFQKTIELCDKVADVEFVVTDNEVEALILEANLIRKFRPKYNVDLKDSHRYAYVLLSKEKFPVFVTLRKNLSDKLVFDKAKGRVFGPFVQGAARAGVLKTLRKAFGIRTCKRLPKKACLKFHLGQCSAPCIRKISKKDYDKNVRLAVRVLMGKTGKVEEELRRKMLNASEKQDFELALEYKSQLEAIRSLSTRQKMELHNFESEDDFIGFVQNNSKASAVVFNVSRGVVKSKEQFVFEYAQEALSGFLTQYYSLHKVPNTVFLENVPKDAKVIGRFIESTRGAKPKFVSPKAGDKKKLLKLVEKNALLALTSSSEPALLELKKALRLEKIPVSIECFDVSTLFGSDSVGAMVRFENAVAVKSAYRRFRIKFVDGQDDFAMMREIVFRRYYRLKNEKMPLPDLVVVDGGKQQVSAAKQALEELGFGLQPLIGLAKEFEEIHFPLKAMPLRLNRKNVALRLLMKIRDEAHRFAINYHKKLRSKASKKSVK
ncbi:MAG: excinuclease ABC subunit UvrC, partial [Candidatus Micrarchaeia archaeon]